MSRARTKRRRRRRRPLPWSEAQARRLDRLGNLPVTVDFRRVYASLLEGWLATDAGSVLPDAATVGCIELIRSS